MTESPYAAALQPEDYFEIGHATDPQISPDGVTCATCDTGRDRSTDSHSCTVVVVDVASQDRNDNRQRRVSAMVPEQRARCVPAPRSLCTADLFVGRGLRRHEPGHARDRVLRGAGMVAGRCVDRFRQTCSATRGTAYCSALAALRNQNWPNQAYTANGWCGGSRACPRSAGGHLSGLHRQCCRRADSAADARSVRSWRSARAHREDHPERENFVDARWRQQS